VFPIPSILKSIGRGRSDGALHLSPLSNGRNECRKLCLTLTLLTRPPTKALLLRLIRKLAGKTLHIPEISAMMREWSMPRADALAELVEGRSRWNRGLSGRKEAS
jgi:hypothetical protein